MKIAGSETSIVEQWEFIDKMVTTNEQGKRIDWLIRNYLRKVATDESGWEVLYVDPEDGRVWELTFPNSEMQGGGPRLLMLISKKDASAKYIF